MTQKQLEDYLWGAANILRGMIDAADFKQYIFPLLFFKRVSDLWCKIPQSSAIQKLTGSLTLNGRYEKDNIHRDPDCKSHSGT
jgi:hypothetical protein